MHARLGVMLAVVGACSNREPSQDRHHSAESAPQEITLLGRSGKPRVTLTSDLDLLDADGHAVGHLDVRGREVVVDRVHQTLDGVMFVDLHHLELRLSLGTLQVDVKADEIWINGQLFGRVAGLPDTREGMRGLAALVIAALVMPPAIAPAAPTDAAVDDPPPPPRPPRLPSP